MLILNGFYYRRKSVENVMSASHDVIESSISQALALTNAMTLPSSSSNENAQKNQNTLSIDDNVQLRSSGSKELLRTPTTPSNSMSENDTARKSSESPILPVTTSCVNSNGSTSSTTVNRLSTSSQKNGITTSSPNICNSTEKTDLNSITSTTSGSINLSISPSSNVAKPERIEKEKKKKKSWFNVLYPTYKSRSEDFKRLFKDVPDDERLVVDYSCALQKEILVHGRLYVSQNYLCFHANIFGWETFVCLQWKQVTSITKEKTALIIPNAILVCTATDKMFFTSFGTRDKAYLMLFRVWQNALMNKQMSQPEMWQWVHFCYGDELGLTSDDEDYVPPNNEDDKLTLGQRLAVESVIFEERPQLLATTPDEGSDDLRKTPDNDADIEDDAEEVKENILIAQHLLMPPLSSTTNDLYTISDSETELENKPKFKRKSKNRGPLSKEIENIAPVVCTSAHDGRCLVNTTIPMHIDTLFTLLFTNSKFFMDFHEQRHTTDLMASMWTENEVTGLKLRTVNLTVALNNVSIGPKFSNVTETQIMLPISTPGQLYAIDVETVNANIPYADSFYVSTHYCLRFVNSHETHLQIFAQIKYKKSIWGLVRAMIEKNCWAGMEEFFQCLTTALIKHSDEIEQIIKPNKRKVGTASRPGQVQSPLIVGGGVKSIDLFPTMTKKVAATINQAPLTLTAGDLTKNLPSTNTSIAGHMCNSSSNKDYKCIIFVALFILIVLNQLLYLKLSSLQSELHLQYSSETLSPPTSIQYDYNKDPPKSHEEWLKIFIKQEQQYSIELNKWHQIVQQTVQLLQKAEKTLLSLQSELQSCSTASNIDSNCLQD